MSNIVELRGQLEDRQKKLGEIFAKGTENMTSDDVDNARALNEETADLAKQIEDATGTAAEMDAMKASLDARHEVQHPGFANGRKAEAKDETPKSLGELFTGAPQFGKVSPGHMGPAAEFNDIDLSATLFQTGAGWAAPSIRSNKVVDYAVRPLLVADILPTINVNLPSYIYMEETTFTNAAVEVAQGSAKPEAALALTERTEQIRKIAVYLPVTDEQLDDVPAARAYIDNRLGYMVRQRLDGQILTGDGTAPNIAGITDDSRTGLQTQAASGAGDPDGVYDAMTKIRVNAFSEPNAVVMHPNDWADFRKLRTADGIYIWGNPADAAPERIFGLRVVQTVAMTENTALVGDFNQAALLLRQGLTMKVGYVNDDLIKNRQTIVAELRAGVAVYRPAAFCTVTSL